MPKPTLEAAIARIIEAVHHPADKREVKEYLVRFPELEPLVPA